MLRLKEVLENNNMSQVKLAKILGVSTVTVNLWDQNNSEPSLKTTLKICEVLNIKLSQLVAQK